jgi:hypothetical protein
MKKKYITYLIIAVILFLIATIIPYFIIKNKIGNNNINDENKDVIENTKDKKDDKLNTVTSEYTLIENDSEIANNLLSFVPKHFQGPNVKIDNEYVIYSAITSMQNKNKDMIDFNVNGSLMQGYKVEDVESEAKTIFGNDKKIIIQNEYKLPIVYSNNMFALMAFGFAGNDYMQYIKEVKESKTKFILTIYAINIEYDLENDKNIRIATKDTFKLYSQNTSDIKTIENTMIKYNLNGIEANAANIVKDYKEQLPTIEYEITKLDERGLKYYLKDIKVNY